MIGHSIGAPIVLAPPNELLGMAVTEGIEDALSSHEACLSARCRGYRLQTGGRDVSVRPVPGLDQGRQSHQRRGAAGT
jgi:hypothetical protein